MAKLKLKKGDKVVALTGRDKGKTGEVHKALPRDNIVIVQGVHMSKRLPKPSPATQGGIVEREAKIHASNVAHADPKDNKPTRIGFKKLEDGTKVRVAKRSGEVID